MDKSLIPFWEETYRKDDVMTFSVEPNKTIKEFEHLITKQSNLLEVGCGEGQNVLYLAKQGYCKFLDICSQPSVYCAPANLKKIPLSLPSPLISRCEKD